MPNQDPATPAPATQTPAAPAAPSASASDPGVNPSAAAAAPSPTVDPGQMIPKYRFDEINQKKKDAEKALEELAAGIVEAQVPENLRSLIPDLAPLAKVKWITQAVASGIFTPKQTSGPDPKRPGEKPPQDFTGLSPTTIMAHGYVKK